MKIVNENGKNKAVEVNIAYIGGGSRGWARELMQDLALEERLNGTIRLYDIDKEAAKANEIIGNATFARAEVKSQWKFQVAETYESALTGADYVVISILPAPLTAMQVDVEYPQKYGIYQSVGDTVGPGGAIRALRTVPMFKEFAENIRKYCPNAWVINYTNPMTICTQTLYTVFPEIKAFGCCHEVFSTQQLLANIYNGYYDANIARQDVYTNVYGINHFTFISEAHYQNVDLFPLYRRFIKENAAGVVDQSKNWMNKTFGTKHLVKFDLFNRYGIIAAAGDRHLAEFCPGTWYLKNPETVAKYAFELTPMSFRFNLEKERLEKTEKLISGEEKLEIVPSGEEGVQQICAIAGLSRMVTNVNVPNRGQIGNLPLGAVVESNASFTGDSVQPVYAGNVEEPVAAIMRRHISNQKLLIEAALTGDYDLAFKAFINDPNVYLPLDEARKLFDEMLELTKEYLPFYDRYTSKK